MGGAWCGFAPEDGVTELRLEPAHLQKRTAGMEKQDATVQALVDWRTHNVEQVAGASHYA